MMRVDNGLRGRRLPLRRGEIETHTDAVAGLPHQRAAAHRLVIDEKLESRRDPERVRDLQAGAIGREVAHGAVEHRALVVQQDLAPAQRPRAVDVPSLFRLLSHWASPLRLWPVTMPQAAYGGAKEQG